MTAACDVLVVGAGIAGLVAARALRASGVDVVVLDKGAAPGGRLATRRIGRARLDHGAQFFTVRSEEFADLVAGWSSEGVEVEVWTRGFATAPTISDGPGAAVPAADGHPRHAVTGGMNRLAKHLAHDLAVVEHQEVQALRRSGAGWSVETAGATWQARRLLLTPPAPQSLALLAAGEVRLPPAAAAALQRLAYAPTLALLVTLDRPLALPGGGGVQLAGGPISWLGDNVAKGASDVPALTVHAAGSWSAAHYDDDDDALQTALLDLVGPWLGAAEPVEAQLKRWRYARPTSSHPARCLVSAVADAPLVCAGDAFGEAKVEGAARSGLAAARALGADG